MRARALLVAALCGTAAFPVAAATPAGAVNPTITVTTFADVVDGGDGVLSLREAVSLADVTAGDDEIELSAGTYPLTICDGTRASEDDTNAHGDLDHFADDQLVVDAASGVVEVVQECEAASGERVFDLDTGGFAGLTIRGGDTPSDGGGIRAEGSVETYRTTVEHNMAGGDGGGIWASGVGAFTSTVSFNTSTGDGGGVAVRSGGPGMWFRADRSSIHDNVAGRDGGGVAAESVYAGLTSFERNEAGRDGGGLAVAGPLDSQIASSIASDTFVDNTAGRDGGGLLVSAAESMGELEIRGNTAGRNGGGAHLTDISSCCLGTSTVTGNEATGGAGGGIFLDGRSSPLGAMNVTDNTALIGGGIAVTGQADVQGIALLDNHAVAGTAAAGVPAEWPAGEGGGYALLGGSVWIFDVTVDGNTAAVAGGGATVLPATLPRNHSLGWQTITANSAPAAANVRSRTAEPTALVASVLAEPLGGGVNCVGDAGFQTSFPSYSTDASCAFGGLATSVNGGTDPKLGPLTDTGGFAFARVPALDSPLRGAGAAGGSGVDIWLRPRPQGAADDIGAVEQREPFFHTIAPARIVDTRKGLGAPAGTIGPGEEIVVQVTGAGGVPVEHVTAAALTVTAVDPSADTHLTVWPDGTPRPSTSTLNAPAGRTLPNTAVVRVSPDGEVRVRNNSGETYVLVDVTGWSDDATIDTGAPFTGVAPSRLFDTRNGTGTVDAPLGPGATRVIDVPPPKVPPGSTAVVVNLTAVAPTAESHVTAWATGATKPGASNLNLAPGETVANLAIVPISVGGSFSLYNSSGTTELVGDIVGYVGGPGNLTQAGYHPFVTARVLDTRTPAPAPLTAGVPRDVQVTGSSGVPATASAVVVNLTGITPSAAAHLTGWASGAAKPATSNLNLPAGVTRANLAVVPVGTDGRIRLQLSSGTAHAAVDVVGYFD
jgi:hypothetical protein